VTIEQKTDAEVTVVPKLIQPATAGKAVMVPALIFLWLLSIQEAVRKVYCLIFVSFIKIRF